MELQFINSLFPNEGANKSTFPKNLFKEVLNQF